MLAGLIFLGFGILFLISAIYPDFAINYRLVWPMLLILISLYQMIKNKKIEAISGVIFFIGVIFFAVEADLVPGDFRKILWPGILIIVGISLIWEASVGRKRWKHRPVTTEGAMTYNGIFAGVEERIKDKNYKGSNIYSVFGGVDLDLREVELKEESVIINVYSIFGGSTLLVPKDYNIVVNSTAILGGNDNKCNNEFKEGNKTIYINCVSVFGGAEIK